jgi:hypothetical protein
MTKHRIPRIEIVLPWENAPDEWAIHYDTVSLSISIPNATLCILGCHWNKDQLWLIVLNVCVVFDKTNYG